MSAGGVLLGRPSAARLRRLLRAAVRSELSYDHVGSTLDPDSGTPERVRRHEVVLGRGDECADLAADGLRRWVCQQGIGASVHPPDAPIQVGTTLLVLLRAGPVTIVVPNRIVAVVDEPRRFGFAYGTLDGHQERGEESFLVERLADGTVRGVIAVDAVPATVPARVAAPVVRRLQIVALQRYLDSLLDFVRQRSG